MHNQRIAKMTFASVYPWRRFYAAYKVLGNLVSVDIGDSKYFITMIISKFDQRVIRISILMYFAHYLAK
jgi:hypothetical protein